MNDPKKQVAKPSSARFKLRFQGQPGMTPRPGASVGDATKPSVPPRYETTRVCDGVLLEAFEPTVRDSDVFVVAASKCGQTWLQALLHHLKTRGCSVDFGGRGLLGVSPWLELPTTSPIHRQRQDRAARLAELEAFRDPRVFKMHVPWSMIPRPAGSGAKVVTITRDPRDVVYSMFCHLRIMKGAVVPDRWDEYFEQWFERSPYFRIVQSFWPHRADPDVLWLCYEEMHRDARGHAQRLVEFLGWQASSAELDRAVELAAFENLQRSEKTAVFAGGAHMWREDGRFFRQGAVGENRKQLDRDQERRIVERCHAELGPEASVFVLRLP